MKYLPIALLLFCASVQAEVVSTCHELFDIEADKVDTSGVSIELRSIVARIERHYNGKYYLTILTKDKGYTRTEASEYRHLVGIICSLMLHTCSDLP